MGRQTEGTVLTIDPTRRGEIIDPRLFGHNLEHTRSSVWRGLSAQLIQNRKFYGKSQPNGVALDWQAIQQGHTHFELESVGTYTSHFSPKDSRRRNEVNCQRISVYASGGAAGITQAGIPLHRGWEYQGRVALRIDQPAPVLVSVADPAGHPIFEKTFNLEPGGWVDLDFNFVPDITCEDARMAVALKHATTLRVGAVSLLPADNFHGMRRDVVALLKEIGCKLIRWPGGNFAGDYRWQDGLLPVDRRAPLAAATEMETLPHTRGFDCHEIGTDEFVALCREIGAEPCITINLAWDSPEMCAAWVEYCNGPADSEWGRKRAERGYREPYGVKLWSLGNELGYGHMEGPNTPATYAEKANACAQAMRKTDPSVELIMSGLWCEDGWFTEGLARLADKVGHLSHHHYTRQPRTYAGDLATQEFLRVAKAPGQVLQGLQKIRGKTDVHSEGRRVGIAFDEWNVWYAWYRHPGVAEGIHNASMLNMLLREAGKQGISMACFFEPVNEGAILVKPFDAFLPAGGQVFALLKSHTGNTLIELAPLDQDGDVDATASLDRQTGRIVLTAVNRNPDAGRKLTIILKDTPLADVDSSLLAAPDYLPGTDFAEHRLPVIPRENGFSVVLPKHSVGRLVVQLRSV